jgi:hypothetical protein
MPFQVGTEADPTLQRKGRGFKCLEPELILSLRDRYSMIAVGSRFEKDSSQHLLQIFPPDPFVNKRIVYG